MKLVIILYNVDDSTVKKGRNGMQNYRTEQKFKFVIA